MSTRPFRFIHASDFHLEQPLMGVAEVPDHLRECFLESPYTAARQVFETALVEDAEFLVLSGDILHPHGTGPRGPLFLVEQFARLAERGINVYWAGGEVDSLEEWPSAVTMPKNVHVFPNGRVEEIVVPGETGPRVRLAGFGRDQQRPFRPSDFSADPAGLFTIAIAHGDADPAVLQTRGIHYWALGGRHDRSTPQSGSQIIHYCGSPQGRRPREAGIHGCTLVEVDQQGQTRTSLIPTDAVRWMNERILVDETTAREDLEARLREHVHTFLEALPSTGLLISWTISGCGPMMTMLRGGRLADELLQWLRGDYGYRSPAAWSVSLDVELSETLPPEWYEQESIRGDFLRAIRQLQMNSDETLDLEQYVAETHQAGTLADLVALADRSTREGVLRETAALGVDLLSGEESHA